METRKKILLATGLKSVNQALRSDPQLEMLYDFGTEDVIRRNSLLDTLQKEQPDYLIIFDTLKTEKDAHLDWTTLFRALNNSTYIDNDHVVFVTSHYQAGSKVLDAIVSNGFYNIISSPTPHIDEILSLLTHPRSPKSGLKYLAVRHVKDNDQQVLFSAPKDNEIHRDVVVVPENTPPKTVTPTTTSKPAATATKTSAPKPQSTVTKNSAQKPQPTTPKTSGQKPQGILRYFTIIPRPRPQGSPTTTKKRWFAKTKPTTVTPSKNTAKKKSPPLNPSE